jgi:hypothetical protein
VKAYISLRHAQGDRAKAFHDGVRSLGYQVIWGDPPGDGDLYLTWGRIGHADILASRFGGKVIVVENASWGKSFAGHDWYHIANNYHNLSGMFPIGGNDRFDSLGVEFDPFREEGETVVLLQRGMGAKKYAQPRGWGRNFDGRIRSHPGRMESIPLEYDLRKCKKVITWGSGAAIKALMMGIHVESHLPNWIGEQDNTEEGRLNMFRRLAWAQWRLDEIRSGECFRWLL